MYMSTYILCHFRNPTKNEKEILTNRCKQAIACMMNTSRTHYNLLHLTDQHNSSIKVAFMNFSVNLSNCLRRKILRIHAFRRGAYRQCLYITYFQFAVSKKFLPEFQQKCISFVCACMYGYYGPCTYEFSTVAARKWLVPVFAIQSTLFVCVL